MFKGRAPRLTKSQFIVLEAAAKAPSGAIGFAAGDRRGTRVGRVDELGRPWIIAYQNPEFFLASKKLLEATNERWVYRITDLGREALAANLR